jgi:hypothetical protein
MNMFRRILVALVVVFVAFPLTAYCFVTYTLTPGTMGRLSSWSEELIEVLETESLVMGMSGPIKDWYVYCAGDTRDLNLFLQAYARVPDAPLKLVLHPGNRSVNNPPVGKPVKEAIDVDWLLHIEKKLGIDETQRISVDVWLGGNIELEDLVVPKNIDVQSGGEIENFVAQHNENRDVNK